MPAEPNKQNRLEFPCQNCDRLIPFSPKETIIHCMHCRQKYEFTDEILCRQLTKFEALCNQIVESEEILGNVNIGIDIGDRRVAIPYKLLLTRLKTSLKLIIEGKPFEIIFRTEPLTEFSKTNKAKHESTKTT